MIFVRGDALFTVDDPQSLVNIVAEEILGTKDHRIVFVDSTGEGFKYFDKDIKSLKGGSSNRVVTSAGQH